MSRTSVEWVPLGADKLLTRRQLVRTSEEPDIGLDSILFGVGAVAIPLGALIDAPTPLVARLAFCIGLGIVCLICCLWSFHGLYLSTAGVMPWRFVLPRRLIPWHDVASFTLVSKTIDFGKQELERLAVVTIDGTVIDFWDYSRSVSFESDSTPVASVKAKLRTFPQLVEQLNAITQDVKRRA